MLDFVDNVVVIGRNGLDIFTLVGIVLFHFIVGQRNANNDGTAKTNGNNLQLITSCRNIGIHGIIVTIGRSLGSNQHKHVLVRRVGGQQLVHMLLEFTQRLFLAGIAALHGGGIGIGLLDKFQGIGCGAESLGHGARFSAIG